MLEYKGLKIHWLGHAGFKIISTGNKVVYIDPYQITPREAADVIVITHDHFDHCSPADIRGIIKSDTVIVTTSKCKNKLGLINARFVEIVPGKAFRVDGIKVEAIPAYNTNKFRSPGVPYHPKRDGNIGTIITINDVRVFHAGDSDFTLEMKSVKTDVALLPVSGTYVMTAEEAAQAANVIKPDVAIPMHYGSVLGSEADAHNFEKMAKCKVEILKKG